MSRRLVWMTMLWVVLLGLLTVLRGLFVLGNLPSLEGVSTVDVLLMLVNGAAIDLSAVMLAMIVPWLMVLLSVVWRVDAWWRKVMTVYVLLLWGCFTAVFASDLQLYDWAGHRLDADALRLFAGGVSLGGLLHCLMMWVVTWFAGGCLLWALTRGVQKFKPVTSRRRGVLLMILAGVCIMLGAGWFSGRVPRYGAAYFSSHSFMNSAAINPTMSLVESALVRPDYSPMEVLAQRKKPVFEQPAVDSLAAGSVSVDSLRVLSDEALLCADSVVEMLPVERCAWRRMVRSECPDVLIVVMNGVTRADFDRAEGGRYVMSYLNTLCSEGYLFENAHAASLGVPNAALVAVTSGYMTLPGAASQDIPFKCERMASLTSQLDSVGYHTEVWYGGDLLHNNMRAYLYGTGFDNVVDAHKLLMYGVVGAKDDAVVLPMMVERMLESDEPFFGVYVAGGMESGRKLPYQLHEDARSSAAAFVDEQIGVMVRRFKYGGVWDNVLLVVVGDSDGVDTRVPMMIVGGAVEGFGVVERVASQIDLPVTLARQLGLDSEAFPYGRDLATNEQTEAYFTFEGGYGVADEKSVERFRLGQPEWGADSLSCVRRYRAEEFLWGAYDELRRR